MKGKFIRVLIALVLVLSFSLVTAVPVRADVTVTPASGGGAISADDYGTATWTSLTGPVIAESAAAEIGTGTIIFTVPSGLEFNPAQDVTAAVTGSATLLVLASATATPTATTITFTVNSVSATNPSTITFSDIQVRPTAGTVATGNILTTGSGSVIAGVTHGTTNFGTLTMVAGVVTKLAFTVNPVSVSGLVFSTQPTIEAQDQYSNINTSFADDITISVKTGPGALDIGTATQAMTSGTLTTSGLGYTATADQEDFTLAANDAGNDLTEGVSGTVTCDVIATQLVFTTQPAAGANSGALLGTQPIVTAKDAGNLVDTGFTETVTITADVGTLSGDVDIAAVLGVAEFTDLVHTASADNQVTTLTANDEDGVDTNLPTVNADTFTTLVIATKLVFTTQPAGSVSGIALTTQPVVEAQDAANVLDEDYVTNVVASEDDAGALSGTTTVTPVAGEATFTDLVYTAAVDGETFQIDVTSGTLTGATSNGVTCDVVATKLVIVTQPDGAVTNVNLVLQPVINAVDADGTLDTGWTTKAEVVRESGTGTVTGADVSPMVSGVATFTDVKVVESPVTHDSYTLRFTSSGLTYVVSDAFKVYDKILDLNNNAWTLISTDDYIISTGGDTSAFEGSVSLKYVYTGSSYVTATVADIKPVEALYLKTTGSDGLVGLNYSTTASPGASIKSLLAGWNLVSSATSTAAGTVLSPLRYVDVGEQEGTGLATLVSQGSYNINTADWYIDATTWTNVTGTMNPFDGYWVYMNAAKSFGVIPQ